MRYSIGVDVGGTFIKFGAVNENGELLYKWEINTRKGENGYTFLKDITNEIKKNIRKQELLRNAELIGIGLDVPGPVLPDGYVEVIVNLSVKNIYPAKILSELLQDIPVRVTNDANAAALGEMWQGAGKGRDSVCMITLGTGVGGGIVNQGKIIHGAHGAGGEMGHIRVNDMELEQCNCGGYGCLEQYTSATGIVRVVKRMLQAENIESDLRKLEKISAKDVCDYAKAGDVIAIKSLRYSMDRLAYAISLIGLITDPQVFVIGGGVSMAGNILVDLIRKELKKYQSIVNVNKYEIVLAELGNDAGIYGSAKLLF